MEAFKASFAFIDNNVLVAKSLNEFIYVSSHAPIYEGSFEKLMLYALCPMPYGIAFVCLLLILGWSKVLFGLKFRKILKLLLI